MMQFMWLNLGMTEKQEEAETDSPEADLEEIGETETDTPEADLEEIGEEETDAPETGVAASLKTGLETDLTVETNQDDLPSPSKRGVGEKGEIPLLAQVWHSLLFFTKNMTGYT